MRVRLDNGTIFPLARILYNLLGIRGGPGEGRVRRRRRAAHEGTGLHRRVQHGRTGLHDRGGYLDPVQEAQGAIDKCTDRFATVQIGAPLRRIKWRRVSMRCDAPPSLVRKTAVRTLALHKPKLPIMALMANAVVSNRK